jgi:hypothetical protein
MMLDHALLSGVLSSSLCVALTFDVVDIGAVRQAPDGSAHETSGASAHERATDNIFVHAKAFVTIVGAWEGCVRGAPPVADLPHFAR